MKEIKGFTFIELVFVLFIISLLTFLVIPGLFSTLKKQQTKQFFTTFDADILYIQNSALGTSQHVRILFEDDYYVIRNNRTKEAIKRYYPEHISRITKSNNRISFNDSGTIISPTSYRFEDETTTYKIVFPLGKGRHYIEEQ